jgi:hypothetical protein
MTAAELKAYFLAEYDAATSLSAPGWEDSEISTFLNIAQDSIVTELIKNKDLARVAELINTVHAISCASNSVIVNAVSTPISDVVVLPDYFYYLSSRTKVTRTNPVITDEWISNEPIGREDADKFFLTSYNKVWFKYPKIFIEILSSVPVFTVLYDAYTQEPSFIDITYIKKPTRIDITTNISSNLNESLIQTVVQLAVEQAVKSIKVAKIANQ